jgi:hypothetical protein
MPFFNKGIEINHSDVITESGHDDFAGDPDGERSEGCKHGSFRHLEGGKEFQRSDEDFGFEGTMNSKK